MKEIERFYESGLLSIDELISELKGDTEEACRIMGELACKEISEPSKGTIVFKTTLGECGFVNDLKELLVNRRLDKIASEVCTDYKDCELPELVIGLGATASPKYKGECSVWNMEKNTLTTGISIKRLK